MWKRPFLRNHNSQSQSNPSQHSWFISRPSSKHSSEISNPPSTLKPIILDHSSQPKTATSTPLPHATVIRNRFTIHARRPAGFQICYFTEYFIWFIPESWPLAERAQLSYDYSDSVCAVYNLQQFLAQRAGWSVAPQQDVMCSTRQSVPAYVF